jgi:hypothetical protein
MLPKLKGGSQLEDSEESPYFQVTFRHIIDILGTACVFDSFSQRYVVSEGLSHSQSHPKRV